jgi:lysyl-tRNA synthetase class 2
MEDFQKLWVREAVIDSIRSYFKGRGFHEVETPLLLPTPSTEPYLEVFQTELKNDRGMSWPAFLPTSPEFALKKLLARGSGSIFEITKSFRNGEGQSSRHNPEFSILEWYEVDGDYMSVAIEIEKLIQEIYRHLYKKTDYQLSYQGNIYDLSGSWEKMTVVAAFQKYAGIDTETMLDEAKLKIAGRAKGYQVSEETTWEEIWNQIIANEIEPKLGMGKPTILYDYPLAQAVLAKRKESDPRFAERWELYLGGLELANCFSELTDWREQERRCIDNLAERKHLGKTEFPMDKAFIDALKKGMPECGGVAVGIDRLVMLLTDSATIDEVLPFPAGELFS